MKPLTVLHATPTWLPQTQTWMYQQVRSLPAGVSAHVVCQTTENLEQFPVKHLHCLADAPPVRQLWERGLTRLGLRPRFGYAATIARRHRADLLHTHFGDLGWAYLGVAARARIRHVTTFYGYDVNFLPRAEPIWRDRYRELFARVDAVLCEGASMARRVAGLGCPEDKLRVHHLGIPLETIRFEPRRLAKGEPIRILIAASFQEKKGIPYAIAAIARLGHRPFELTIVGDANAEARSQAVKQDILAAIGRHQLESRCQLLGYQSHASLLALAYRHHLFLQPSVTADDGDCEGGLPVTLLEMAATGMPVVSSVHCDIPEAVLHPTTGLLAPERDVPELARCLGALIDQPERWLPMAAAARAHLEAEYDATTQGRRLHKIYADVVGR